MRSLAEPLRRDLVLDILGGSAKMKVVPPDGAFYAFVGVEGCLRAGEDSTSFAERLLEAEKVAVVPGTPFGEPRFVRLSFALDLTKRETYAANDEKPSRDLCAGGRSAPHRLSLVFGWWQWLTGAGAPGAYRLCWRWSPRNL